MAEVARRRTRAGDLHPACRRNPPPLRPARYVAVSASQARAAINKFLRDNGFGKLSDVLLIEKGTPFAAIEAGIHQLQPDLLVIGTRGYGGLKRLLLGSVAYEVLRQVECDILAVPASRTIQ